MFRQVCPPESLDAISGLESWLSRVSDPNVEPWPDFQMDENGEPPSDNAEAVDPTRGFKHFTEADETSDTTPEDQNNRFSYRGKRDGSGRFHIFGTVRFENGDVVTSEFRHGLRHGQAVVESKRNDIARLCGTYVEGKMQGKAKLITRTTSVVECYLRDGVIHGGPVRRIVMKKFREFRRQLSFVGSYSDGRPSGPCWEHRDGGGYLHGVVDPGDGSFSGDNLAFIYPDLFTAFVGKFVGGRMVAGHPAKVSNVTYNSHGIAVCKYMADLSVPRDDMTCRFSLSTRDWIGEEPMFDDPYESAHIECRSSAIQDAGEGLYAKHDIPEGSIVAFYNGVRLPFELLGRPPEKWESSGYKIHVNADYESGLRMDIPPKYVSRDNYRATLGHKMNHSFQSNCFEWFFDHPRFGVIPCEKTRRFVAKGEELTLDYEYDPNNCPAWFSQALDAFLSNVNEEQLQNISKKYKDYHEFLMGNQNGIS